MGQSDYGSTLDTLSLSWRALPHVLIYTSICLKFSMNTIGSAGELISIIPGLPQHPSAQLINHGAHGLAEFMSLKGHRANKCVFIWENQMILQFSVFRCLILKVLVCHILFCHFHI